MTISDFSRCALGSFVAEVMPVGYGESRAVMASVATPRMRPLTAFPSANDPLHA